MWESKPLNVLMAPLETFRQALTGRDKELN